MRTARAVVIVAALAGITALAVMPAHSERRVPEFPQPQPPSELHFGSAAEADSARSGALTQAEVWKPTNVARANLGESPPDPSGLLSAPQVRCRFQPSRVQGTTPKFRCVLENGEVVRVKYGQTPEVPAELAATRLLSALGFGADRVWMVPHLRCYGCPRWTFRSMWIAERVGARQLIGDMPVNRYTDFEWVAVERRFPGHELVGSSGEGWAWFELSLENGSSERRARLDALRLVARFLAHWDNKAANQRLVCQGSAEGSTCRAPFAIIQDLGATFGPRKMDLEGWRGTPVWADRSTCRITMRDLPYAGGTFLDTEISERGRLLLARQLAALGDGQIEALFRGAAGAAWHGSGTFEDVSAWVRAFKVKVEAIASGPACPS